MKMKVKAGRICIFATLFLLDGSLAEVKKSALTETSEDPLHEDGVIVYYPLERGSKDVPVVSVFSFPDGVPRYELTLAVWINGRIIWSVGKLDNQADFPMFGGVPYREAHIPPEKVEELLHKLDDIGVFSDYNYNNIEASLDPDQNYQTINLIHGKRAVCLTMPLLSDSQGRISFSEPEVLSNSKRFKVYSHAEKIVKSCIPSAGKTIEFGYVLQSELRGF